MANNPGGSQSWTWTESGGSAQGWSYTILEFSGADTTSPLDLAIVDSATGGTSSTTHDTGPASGTTQAGDLLIAFFGSNRSTPPTTTISASSVPSSGWTVDTQYNSTGASPNAGSVAAWQILGSGTTATNPDCIGTSSATTSGEAFLLTFQAAAGGGGGGPTPNPLELTLMSVG
jgi:hypothetical protein